VCITADESALASMPRDPISFTEVALLPHTE